MPQLTTITINDGLSTPVPREFTMADRNNGVSTLRYVPSDAHIHQARKITMSSKTMGDGARKVQVKLVIPIQHTASASESFAGDDNNDWQDMFCTMSFKLPEYADTVDRDDLLAFTANLLQDTVLGELVVNVEGIW